MLPPSSPAAHLDVMQGPLQGQVLPLMAPETIVGRDATCGMSLSTHREVSRRHARFYFRNGTWCVEDLGSTNGTFVNNVRASPSFSLDDGVLIQMGDFHARFRTVSAGTQNTLSGATQLSPVPPSTPLPATYSGAVVPVGGQLFPVIYPPEPPKQIALALLFSLLLVGGGQFYNGEISKGVTLLCCSFCAAIFGFLTCGVLWFAFPIIWICGIIDAVQNAERINRESGWQRPY